MKCIYPECPVPTIYANRITELRSDRRKEWTPPCIATRYKICGLLVTWEELALIYPDVKPMTEEEVMSLGSLEYW